MQLPFEANISTTHVFVTYTFVDNLPLTKIYKSFFYCLHLFYDILAGNLNYFTYDNIGSVVGTSPQVWMFGNKEFDITLFTDLKQAVGYSKNWVFKIKDFLNRIVVKRNYLLNNYVSLNFRFKVTRFSNKSRVHCSAISKWLRVSFRVIMVVNFTTE